MRHRRHFCVESLEDRVALSAGAIPASAHHVASLASANVGPALAQSMQHRSSQVSVSTYFALARRGPSGGQGGSPFDDGELGNFIRSFNPLPFPILAGGVQIARVRVFSGAYIDSIQVTYAPSAGITGQPGKHGGGGGARKDLLLQPGEYITEVSGRSGDYVDSLTIRTGGSRSQTMTWGGSGGSRSFDYKAPPGTQIVGFWGRSGQYLDAIGVNMATPLT